MKILFPFKCRLRIQDRFLFLEGTSNPPVEVCSGWDALLLKGRSPEAIHIQSLDLHLQFTIHHQRGKIRGQGSLLVIPEDLELLVTREHLHLVHFLYIPQLLVTDTVITLEILYLRIRVAN